MNNLISSFTHASSETEIFIFAVTLFLCWNLESIAGLTASYKKWEHAYLNVKFIFTNVPLQFFLGFAFARIIQWTGSHHFGIIYNLPFMKNNFLLFMITFLFLDFGEYIYHLVMHKVHVLWRFHEVHHSDNIVDSSTTFREHPGENTIRNIFTLLWVFLGGVVFWALLLRQIIQIFSNIFSHVNYRLPQKLDNIVTLFFITPNMHHVHHHYQQPYTDCNYGDVLSIWDRMFGTFNRLSVTKVVFGIDTCMEKKIHSRYISLMKMPFTRYIKKTR